MLLCAVIFLENIIIFLKFSVINVCAVGLLLLF